jgi:hypothetical protein
VEFVDLCFYVSVPVVINFTVVTRSDATRSDATRSDDTRSDKDTRSDHDTCSALHPYVNLLSLYSCSLWVV